MEFSGPDRSRLRCWADLQPELLGVISEYLETRSDVANFRATCNNWRLSILPPPLRLTPDLPATFTVAVFYGPIFASEGDSFLVVPTSVFLLRQPRRPNTDVSETAWLVGVEQPFLGTLGLTHPLFGCPFGGPKSLSGFEAVEIHKGARLMLNDGVTPALPRINSVSPKMVVWNNDVGRYLVVLHATGVVECLCAHMGLKSYVRYGLITKFDDVACWRGFVLVIDRKGRLFVVKPLTSADLDLNQDSPPLSNARVEPVVDSSPPIEVESKRRKRLLVDGDDVYLVARCSVSDKCLFEVFKLNQELFVWEWCLSLGDRVMFVTEEACFFAWASDLGPSGFESNCIVFPKDCFPDRDGCNAPDDDLFREAHEYVAVGVCKYDTTAYFSLISSVVGYRDLLWPPPSLVWVNKAGYLRPPPKSKGKEIAAVQTEIQDQWPYGESSMASFLANRFINPVYFSEIGARYYSQAYACYQAGPSPTLDLLSCFHNKDVAESSSRSMSEDPSAKINVRGQPTFNIDFSKGNLIVQVAQTGCPPQVIPPIEDEDEYELPCSRKAEDVYDKWYNDYDYDYDDDDENFAAP